MVTWPWTKKRDRGEIGSSKECLVDNWSRIRRGGCSHVYIVSHVCTCTVLIIRPIRRDDLRKSRHVNTTRAGATWHKSTRRQTDRQTDTVTVDDNPIRDTSSIPSSDKQVSGWLVNLGSADREYQRYMVLHTLGACKRVYSATPSDGLEFNGVLLVKFI